jgi:hypothetical protein
MWEELENALAWYAAAPSRWVASAKQDLSAAAEWIWTVVQGDFAEEQTTAQTITGTVIAMIPFVDQLCDVRDLVANCRKIHEDSENKWAWVALVLTLIGLFPTLGSLAKGCFKVLFAYGRKGVLRAGSKTLDSDVWKATKPWVEAGVRKLNEFLARPEVRQTLAKLKIDNPYKYLSKLARELAGKLNTAILLKTMDGIIAVLKDLLGMVQKWGTAAMSTQAGELLKLVAHARELANRKLAEALQPVQHWLDRLARRLEVEADMNYRAYTNALNPHGYMRPTLDAEIAALKANPPEWVQVRRTAAKEPLERCPEIVRNYPDISDASKDGLLKGQYKTFHTITSKPLPPGTVLYRVVDPRSADNSLCWMTKEEFEKLASKSEWRRRFAVWANWNDDGEFVTYTVPPGKPLLVWEGETASQQLRDRAGNPVRADDKGNTFWIEGGARQIVLDPKDLDKAYIGKRQLTGWGYGSFGGRVDLTGVPVLHNNWYESKK